jgi:hypothetical protein
MRSFSQIPVRTAFLMATEAVVRGSGVPSADDSTLSFPDGYPGSIIVDGALGAQVYPAVAQGELLKDMGRSITIVNDAGAHLALYREVQRVLGSGSEGVGAAGVDDGAYGTFFIKVWSADGNGVVAVRIG